MLVVSLASSYSAASSLRGNTKLLLLNSISAVKLHLTSLDFTTKRCVFVCNKLLVKVDDRDDSL